MPAPRPVEAARTTTRTTAAPARAVPGQAQRIGPSIEPAIAAAPQSVAAVTEVARPAKVVVPELKDTGAPARQATYSMQALALVSEKSIPAAAALALANDANRDLQVKGSPLDKAMIKNLQGNLNTVNTQNVELIDRLEQKLSNVSGLGPNAQNQVNTFLKAQNEWRRAELLATKGELDTTTVKLNASEQRQLMDYQRNLRLQSERKLDRTERRRIREEEEEFSPRISTILKIAVVAAIALPALAPVGLVLGRSLIQPGP